MPKQTVCRLQCERCKRVWFPEQEADSNTPSLKLELKGPAGEKHCSLSFDVLCAGCTRTVLNLVEGIARVMKNNSPKSRAKKKEPEKTSPGPLAPGLR